MLELLKKKAQQTTEEVNATIDEQEDQGSGDYDEVMPERQRKTHADSQMGDGP